MTSTSPIPLEIANILEKKTKNCWCNKISSSKLGVINHHKTASENIIYTLKHFWWDDILTHNGTSIKATNLHP